MEIYIYLFLLMGASAILLSKKHPQIFLWVNGIFITAVATLRYGIGFDYYSYEALYQTIGAMPWRQLPAVFHKEWGFVLWNKGMAALGADYRTFLFSVNAFMTGVLFWWLSRNAKNICMAVFFYPALQIFAHSMNLLRQSLAAVVFLFAFSYLKQKRLLPYCAVVLLASLFHLSALFMLPFYFLLAVPVSVRNTTITLMVAAVCYLCLDRWVEVVACVMPGGYLSYMDSLYWQANGLRFVLFPFVYACIGCFYYKNSAQNEKDGILFQAVLYLFVISCFITKHFVIERLSLYFYYFLLLLLPKSIETVSRPAMKRVACAVLIGIGISHFSFAAREGFHHVYPYYSIFDKIEAV